MLLESEIYLDGTTPDLSPGHIRRWSWLWLIDLQATSFGFDVNAFFGILESQLMHP
jgi:hypothetical protein